MHGLAVPAEEGEHVVGVVSEGRVERVADGDVNDGLHPLRAQEAAGLDEGAGLGEEAVLCCVSFWETRGSGGFEHADTQARMDSAET